MKLSLLTVLCGVLVGCATTGPRKPQSTSRETTHVAAMELSDEGFRHAVVARARVIGSVPSDVQAAARRLFDVGAKQGSFEYDVKTGRLLELKTGERVDRSAAVSESEILTRDYLRWCEGTGRPGDCLRLLSEMPELSGDARFALALSFAQHAVWGEMMAAFKDMANPQALVSAVLWTCTTYLLLITIPEPVTKGLAAMLTATLIAYIGVDTFWGLVVGFKQLMESSARATSFRDLRAAGERYGGVMGMNAARAFLMLATVAMGNTASGFAAKVPGLPGYSAAAAMAESQGGFQLGVLADVRAVAVSAEGATVSLASGVVAMAAWSPDAALIHPQPGRLTGRPTRPSADDSDPTNISATHRENESARILADHGYHVEQNPPPKANGKKPDYRIQGEYYDCYAPNSPRLSNIRTTLEQKVAKRQASRIVLNLEDTVLTVEEVATEVLTHPVPDLQELIVIKGGRVFRVWPR